MCRYVLHVCTPQVFSYLTALIILSSPLLSSRLQLAQYTHLHTSTHLRHLRTYTTYIYIYIQLYKQQEQSERRQSLAGRLDQWRDEMDQEQDQVRIAILYQ